MKAKLFLLLLALMLLGCGVWSLFGESRPVVSGPASRDETAETDGPVLLSVPSDPGTSEGAEPETLSVDRVPEWEQSMATISGAKYRIAVTLRGVLIADPSSVDARLSATGEYSLTNLGMPFDGKDTVWYALDEPFEDPQTALLIHVHARGILPSKTYVPWSDLKHERDAEGRETWRTSVTLSEGVVQRGLVIDPEGLPVAEAWIEGYAVHEGPIPRAPYTAIRSDGHGRFELRLRAHTVTLLVASKGRFVPASLRVDGSSTRTPQPQITMTLATGRSIEGQILWEGAPPPKRHKGWTVWFERTSADTATFGAREGWYLDAQDKVQRAWGTIEASDDGTFRIHGLPETPFEVRADECRNAEFPIDSAIMNAAQVVVRPPAHDLVMDLRPAWIQLVIQTEDQETPTRFSVGMESKESGWWTQFPAWPDPALPVAPETEYTLHAGADGYVQQDRVVNTPIVGETLVARFVLKRPPHPATLTVEFGALIEHKTVFALHPLAEGAFPDDSIYSAIEPRHGAFTMQVPAGRWRLECFPGRSYESPPRHWKPVKQIIDVPSAGTVVHVPVERGGLLHVNATDGDRSPLAGTVEVIDSGEQVVPLSWLKPRKGRWSLNGDPTLGPAGFGWAKEPIDPGPYTVRVRMAGYEMWEGAVNIERGKTASIHAQLKRKP